MMRQFSALFAALILFATVVGVHADVVILNDGNQIIGTIVAEDFELVTLRTRNGDMPIRRHFISEIRRSVNAPLSPMEPLQVDVTASLPALGVINPPSTVSDAPAIAAEPVAAPAPVASPAGEPVPVPTGAHTVPSEIPPNYAGRFFMIDGEVLLTHDGQTNEAQLNDLIAVGDQIHTGEGRTKIILRGRGEVRLPPESLITVVALDDTGLNVTLDLQRGRIWVDVETPDTGGLNFRVTTPDLTAGVRGTTFHVAVVMDDAEENREGSMVAVLEGRVTADAQVGGSNTRFVNAGYEIFCDTEGNFTAPTPIEIDLEDEFRQWDDWALETHQDLAMVTYGPGGAAISSMINLNAADQQRHATIVAEGNRFRNLNQQGAFIQSLGAHFLRYAADTGDLPPSEDETGADGWLALQTDPGIAGWAGPYVPLDTAVPIPDGWGRPIHWRQQVSAMSGNHYGELISAGPNGFFDEGLNDDIKQMVVLPPDIQARVKATNAP